MPIRNRQLLHNKAKQIYNEIKGINGLDQLQVFSDRLDQIPDENERAAIEMLVWYWVGHGAEQAPKTDWLSVNTILAATCAITFLVGWLELGISWVWSSALALTLTVLVRILFRTFDRGFVFRRLFIACIGSGLLLVGPAQFQLEVNTPFGKLSWGGAPDYKLIIVWSICTLVTAVGAFWEHVVSDRS